jgi:DNA-binding transcriptional ArsR family regulator
MNDSNKKITQGVSNNFNDFVLEKGIFANIFEKDIRRVYIYKKAERLAKAIHLITPAFSDSVSLRQRIDGIAVGLIDAAMSPPGAARASLSRELLALSSMLSIARTAGLLSPMNTEIISREAQLLLQEVTAYEEPRLFLDDTPTLSGIAKSATKLEMPKGQIKKLQPAARDKHVIKDISKTAKPISIPRPSIQEKGNDSLSSRRESVLSILKDKKSVSIKDISTLIRGISEKTIQRELISLIDAGLVLKQGERRWSTYSLVSS